MLCGDLTGRKSEKVEMYVYVSLIHSAVQQKLTPQCKATILRKTNKRASLQRWHSEGS